MNPTFMVGPFSLLTTGSADNSALDHTEEEAYTVSDRCDWQQRARTNARVTNDSGVTISVVDLNKRDFRGNARLEPQAG
jgi:hypothetical protein